VGKSNVARSPESTQWRGGGETLLKQQLCFGGKWEIMWDSRRTGPPCVCTGELYVPLRGEKQEGSLLFRGKSPL